jgi:hypothetical protein
MNQVSRSSRRLGFLALAFFCFVAPSDAAARAPVGATAGTPSEDPAAPAATGTSPAWLSRVQSEMAASEYEISWHQAPARDDRNTAAGVEPRAGWQAPNRAQNLRIHFTEAGLCFVPRETPESRRESGSAASPWECGLTLLRHGRPGALRDARGAPLSVNGHRGERVRGGLVEWYVNEPRGIEHGFTLDTPPGGDEDGRGKVFIELALSGTLDPVFAADGQAIDFRKPGGGYVLRYAELKVTDALGNELPARMEGFAEPSARGIRIRFQDEGAVYPVTVDPLTTSAAWTAESDQATAAFGISVATAGDVNADGYSDVIIGAFQYDNGQADEGRAYLYHGSASGLASSAAWTAESDQAGAQFGQAVATAGDVNGDGYADVVVGGSFYDNGQTDEGRAYIYLGSATGLATSPAWTAESDQTQAHFGYPVASAGDVNGDGYSDVVIGAYSYDNGQTDEGRAYLYLGSASGLAMTPAWTAESNQANALFGESVASAGDVNGDGYSDVIVGAIYFDNGQADEGRAYLYLGSGSGLATLPAWTAEADQASALFGRSVAAAGDVDGDGYADVVIGSSYSNGEFYEGRAYLYRGSASGLATTPAWTAESDQVNAFFGCSVALAGDVNGDGYSDVVIGGVFYDILSVDHGRAYLYLGSASGLAAIPAWTAVSDQPDSHFGTSSLASAGDVNGDGYSDVIVGAHGYDSGQTDEGGAFLYLGSASGLRTIPSWTAESNQGDAIFGESVASAGDVNGDGYSDVIVGAPGYDSGQVDEGRAYLYLGSASGLASSPAWTAESNQANARFGNSVASAGDVDGDGYSDVIVGAYLYDNGLQDEGRAFVYLGSASGLGPTAAWTAESDQATAWFGASASSAGDVNGDGYSDVLVSAPLYDNGQTDEGRAFLYLGSASGLATSAAWTAESNQQAARFGWAVASAGDVNGDGYSDVVIGVVQYTNGPGQTFEGAAYLYLGSASGLAMTAAWTAESDQETSYFGSSVASAGDVNGDGYSDVIVGAFQYDNGQTDEGRAYLYLGSALGLASSPAWIAESEQAFAQFGDSVASAGDVNGDGYSDVIVGAPTYDNDELDEGRAFVYLGSASGPAAIHAWTAESNQAGAQFGHSVASAGDVNGDGYSDLIVGATVYNNGEAAEGRAFLHYGNGGDGLDRIPRQARLNGTAPVALLGKSDSETAFRLRERGVTPAGRGKVRLEWEVKPLGAPFNGVGLGHSAVQDTGAPAPSGSAVSFDEVVAGLAEGTFYHWRSRIVSTDQLFPRSPWMSLAGNNVTETKLRTAGCVDRDGDGYGGPGDPSCLSITPDCNDQNASIWGTPGPTQSLLFTSKTTLTWNPPSNPGAPLSGLLYDTLRSSTAGGFLGAVCVETNDGPNTTATDATLPAAGAALFYLTRAENACPQGSGSLGTNSAGTPRPGRTCP